MASIDKYEGRTAYGRQAVASCTQCRDRDDLVREPVAAEVYKQGERLGAIVVDLDWWQKVPRRSSAPHVC
jgi:hypothetical protein